MLDMQRPDIFHLEARNEANIVTKCAGEVWTALHIEAATRPEIREMLADQALEDFRRA